jgi:predicted transcriptional regulator
MASGFVGELIPSSPAASVKEGKLTMSEATPDSYSPAGYGQMKTLAARLGEDVRAQLDILAQLNDRSVTEEIRLSIEAWIAASKADPKVQQRAEQVRAEIEREVTTSATRSRRSSTGRRPAVGR